MAPASARDSLVQPKAHVNQARFPNGFDRTMKIIFFLLLSLNIIFFLWESLAREHSMKTSDAALRQLNQTFASNRILLLGESAQPNDSRQIASAKAETSAKGNLPRAEVVPTVESPERVTPKSNKGDSQNPIAIASSRNMNSQVLNDPKPGVENPQNLTTLNQASGSDANCCPALNIGPAVDASLASVKSSEALQDAAAKNQETPPGNLPEPVANESKMTSTASGDNPKRLTKVEKLCYKIGPRQSSASFKSISGFLQTAGIEPSIKSETVKSETGFSVYYPAGSSFDASKANMKKLQDSGVQDLFIVNQGPERGNISLGYFKKRERAENLKRQLEAKNIKAKILTKWTERSTYHLLFEWTQTPDDLKTALLGAGVKNKDLATLATEKCKD